MILTYVGVECVVRVYFSDMDHAEPVFGNHLPMTMFYQPASGTTLHMRQAQTSQKSPSTDFNRTKHTSTLQHILGYDTAEMPLIDGWFARRFPHQNSLAGFGA